MASTVTDLIATVPIGTTPATPVTIPLAVPSAVITRVRWRVPPGPRGNMGFAVSQSGVSVLPSGGGWVIADDEWDYWDLADFSQSGAWGVRGYNTGIYPHSVYLTFQTGTGGLQAPPPETGDIMAGFPTTDVALTLAWQ